MMIVKKSVFVLLILLLVSALSGRANADDKARATLLLQQKVIFSSEYEGVSLASVLGNLAAADFSQNGTLLTLEEMSPLQDEGSIKAIPSATHSLLEWLTLLKQQVPTLQWSVSDDAVHVLLPSSDRYRNILDQKLKADCSGMRTLRQWESIIRDEYPASHCFFDNTGRGHTIWNFGERIIPEGETSPFSFSAKKGITLRAYLTGLARAYGDGYWLAELRRQPADPLAPFGPSYVSFIRVRPLPAQVPEPAP